MLQHFPQGASRLRPRAGSSTAWRIFALLILLFALPSQTFAGPFLGLVELWGVVDEPGIWDLAGLSVGDPTFSWFTFQLGDFDGDSGHLWCYGYSCGYAPPYNSFLSQGGAPLIFGGDVLDLDFSHYGKPDFVLHIEAISGNSEMNCCTALAGPDIGQFKGGFPRAQIAHFTAAALIPAPEPTGFVSVPIALLALAGLTRLRHRAG